MFTCPNCDSETSKLIISSDITLKTLVCPNCHNVDKQIYISLHDKSGNKHCPSMTKGDVKMFENRVPNADGSGVEFRDKRYATKEKLIGDNR